MEYTGRTLQEGRFLTWTWRVGQAKEVGLMLQGRGSSRCPAPKTMGRYSEIRRLPKTLPPKAVLPQNWTHLVEGREGCIEQGMAVSFLAQRGMHCKHVQVNECSMNSAKFKTLGQGFSSSSRLFRLMLEKTTIYICKLNMRCWITEQLLIRCLLWAAVSVVGTGNKDISMLVTCILVD